MKKYLIFLDIDGTLIQENQQPNSTQLPKIIQRLAKKGFLFGLNSNRSFEDIIVIYRKFSLNGPMILENGVYFKSNIKSRRRFLTDYHPQIRNIASRGIKQFISDNKIDGFFKCTDTVDALTSDKYSSEKTTFLLNTFRLYTGSIHILKGKKRDRAMAQKLCKYLQKFFMQEGYMMSITVPKAYGNVIFWPKGTSKQQAIDRIKGKYSSYDIIMIGDDIADKQTLESVDFFFTVGNAAPDVKKTATYVAKAFYTKGVIEILQYITKNDRI